MITCFCDCNHTLLLCYLCWRHCSEFILVFFLGFFRIICDQVIKTVLHRGNKGFGFSISGGVGSQSFAGADEVCASVLYFAFSLFSLLC